MTFEELDAQLPNGLHDAEMLGLQVDWTHGTAAFDLDLWVALLDGRGSEWYRRGRVTFHGLQALLVEPPETLYGSSRWSGGFDIDARAGELENPRSKLPETPGAFRMWMYVSAWNSFIQLAAKDVTLEWTGEEREMGSA